MVKAYTTRVGGGPLPTEYDEEMGNRVRTLGNEYGATTGRPRRCGWFDAVVVRYAVRVNGLSALAVTKLDVLDTLAKIGLCTGYEIDGEVVTEFPGRPGRPRAHHAALRVVRGVDGLDGGRPHHRGAAGEGARLPRSHRGLGGEPHPLRERRDTAGPDHWTLKVYSVSLFPPSGGASEFVVGGSRGEGRQWLRGQPVHRLPSASLARGRADWPPPSR